VRFGTYGGGQWRCAPQAADSDQGRAETSPEPGRAACAPCAACVGSEQNSLRLAHRSAGFRQTSARGDRTPWRACAGLACADHGQVAACSRDPPALLGGCSPSLSLSPGRIRQSHSCLRLPHPLACRPCSASTRFGNGRFTGNWCWWLCYISSGVIGGWPSGAFARDVSSPLRPRKSAGHDTHAGMRSWRSSGVQPRHGMSSSVASNGKW
jgi:hypothetical protein